MLIAAEVLIAGMALYGLGRGGATFAAGMHHVDFSAAQIAPVAAGATPRVVSDDAPPRVHVGGSRRNAPATRVRIELPGSGRLSIEIFGFSTQAIQVDVPSGSHVEIAGCAGADVFVV